jgi:hypothetical protein
LLQQPDSDHASRIILEPEFHPFFVDRLVSFLYTSDYTSRAKTQGVVPALPNHTALPTGTISATWYDIPCIGETSCHVRMYGLAESLDYPALKTCAYGKLVHAFLDTPTGKKAADRVKELVDLAFETDAAKRLCADGEGVLKDLAVVAALGFERESRHHAARSDFEKITVGGEYDGFRLWCKAVKERDGALIKNRDMVENHPGENKKRKKQRQFKEEDKEIEEDN